MQGRRGKLRVGHVVPCTPHQCGMYETVKELVLAERKAGIKAFVVDPRPSLRELRMSRGSGEIHQKAKVHCPSCDEDVEVIVKQGRVAHRPPDWIEAGGVCVAPPEQIAKCDIVVSHSGLSEAIKETCHEQSIPWIHLAHGRPNSSYRLERDEANPVYTSYYKMRNDPLCRGLVTLWPGFEKYWELMYPTVYQFQPFVNLDFWKPTQTEYDFGGKAAEAGYPNVVCGDIWRLDKDPFHVVNAFARFATSCPGARLHLYAVTKGPANPGRDTILRALDERGVLGEVRGVVPHIRDIWNAADVVITPHKIATRTVREALACGAQVVAGHGNPYTEYTADEEDLDAFAQAIAAAWEDKFRGSSENCVRINREVAEREFDGAVTARQFIELFTDILRGEQNGSAD